jgi:pilus assembly protein CpaE
MHKEISVRLEIRNQKLAEEMKKLVSSMEGFHFQGIDGSGPCDLLIFEIGDNLEKELQQLYSLKASASIREIFLSSASLDPRVLIEAKRAGVKIFFQPIRKEEVRAALLGLKENEGGPAIKEEGEKQGKIIYLVGCKGGVGTTTVAVNLASSLVELDHARSVVLTDMSLPFSDMPVFLNINPIPDWGELVKNFSLIHPAFFNNILFKHSSGLFVLPSPSGLDGSRRMNPETIEGLLSIMQKTNDFIVIDGGKSPGGISPRILEMSDSILVITGLTYPCMVNGKRLLSTMYKLGYPHEKIRIIVNRYQKNSPLSPGEAERKLLKEIFWKIPNDFQTSMAALDQGKVLSAVGNGREICKSFKNLATLFLNDGQPGKGNKRFMKKDHHETREKSKWTQLRLKLFYKPAA